MEETRSDFERVFRHAKAVLGWLGFLLLLLYLASGFYSVKPEQRGVVKRFGRVITDNVPPGIHYHWPRPIESVERPRTTEIRSITINFGKPKTRQGQTDGKKLKRQATEGAESQAEQATQSAKVVTPQSPELEATALLTGDENLVLTTLLVQYSISKPKSYLYATTDAESLLHRIVHQATISQYMGMSVDEVLTTGRFEIQKKLKEEIQAKADVYALGVRIASVQIQSVHPPADVARAFRDVASAREDKQKVVRQAEGDRNRRLPKARADADRMISEAKARANEAVEMARGDAQRFVSVWSEYRKAKTVTAHRLYIETLEDILPKVRKLISNPEAERHIPVPRTDFSPDLASPVKEHTPPGGRLTEIE
jgi:membrane protease subunit HflK